MNIRDLFPILKTKANGKTLVYLDNSATTQKPQNVIDTLNRYYREENSNIYRGTYYLSDNATQKFDDVRKKTASFINARRSEEIIFTKGTTESINLVADVFGTKYLSQGDEVIVTTMEHHSNIVPWQITCAKHQATLKVVPINLDGELLFDEIEKLITPNTKLIAVAQVSNVLGTINPVKEIIKLAHNHNIKVLVDGAQGIPHHKVDVQDMDCDFYCFSGHKMYAAMGVGVLYGKYDILNALPPYQSGGEMIGRVSFSGTTFNELPFKFEAGTPNVGDVLTLAPAMEFIESVGYDVIEKTERELLTYCTDEIKRIGGITIYGNAAKKSAVVSFLVDGKHHYDVGTLLDKFYGVAVRTGHHCAQPLMDFYNITGTVRASFAVYNTEEEVAYFIKSLQKVASML